MTSERLRHAVVMGGSVGGLLAAWVLRRHAERVTIVERDVPPEAAQPRRVIPQDRHVHALLLGGVHAFEALLPGFGDELIAAGATPIDFANHCRFYHFGVRKPQFESTLRGSMQTRPLIETCIRQRVLEDPRIAIRYETKATNLRLDDTRRVVLGVDVQSSGGVATPLRADLVVDASGRGSPVSRWLTRYGIRPPASLRLDLDLTYASRWYRPSHQVHDWSALLVYPKQPHEHRGGFIFPAENGDWLVTLVGYGEAPPRTAEGFEAYAEQLAWPDLHAALQSAQPRSPVVRLRVPEQTWRRFDRAQNLPSGLLVMGDALCCLDPLFGQGMTLCAFEAQALERCLARGSRSPGGLKARWLAKAFHGRCAQLLRTPWRLTSMEALRYPAVAGGRSPVVRFLQGYAAQVFALSASSPEVYERFLRVLHMQAPLVTMFRPSIVGRVVLHALRRLGQSSAKTRRPAVRPRACSRRSV